MRKFRIGKRWLSAGSICGIGCKELVLVRQVVRAAYGDEPVVDQPNRYLAQPSRVSVHPVSVFEMEFVKRRQEHAAAAKSEEACIRAFNHTSNTPGARRLSLLRHAVKMKNMAAVISAHGRGLLTLKYEQLRWDDADLVDDKDPWYGRTVCEYLLHICAPPPAMHDYLVKVRFLGMN
jgi:hypothetical protein